jgi:DNA polymerase-1
MAGNPRQQSLFAESASSPAPSSPVTVPVPAAPTAPPDLPQSLADTTAYLIDAHSLIYQVFHAMPEMTSPSGQPVGAVQGFIRDIVDLLENRRPDFLLCAFDAPGTNFRHDLFAEYKAHRDEMPADLQLQIPAIHRLLAALGVTVFATPGYEADDVLATISRELDEAGGHCYIVTSDKDCRQLITDRVRMFNIRKNEIFDDVALHAVWGITPKQVVDFQALVGDSVDNIPGAPGIGPKTATELLAKYGTLDNLYAHLEEIKQPKRRESLINFKDQVYRARELARLDCRVPIVVDWQVARVGRINRDEIAALCREFGFRQLLTRIERLADKLALPPQLAAAAAYQEETPATLLNEEPVVLPFVEAPWEANYKTVSTREELLALCAEMSQQPRLSFDTETTAMNARWAELVGCSFAWKPGEAYYVPFRAPAGEPQLDPAIALPLLKPILESPQIAKLGQNIKYDAIVFRAAGIQVAGIDCDTMVADYLLEPGERSHGLDDLARRYLSHTNIPIAELIGTGKKQIRMDQVPVEKITRYAAEDADVSLRLADLLVPKLKQEQLTELFTTLEVPLIEVLVEMEYNGVKVDPARLKELSERFGARMQTLRDEIFMLAGRELNIDSPKQLAQLLFEELKLPVLKKTKTGASTDAEVLEELALKHPLPAKIVEYRQFTKLKSTYADALMQLIHPHTGRVHTSFKQDVAATGRLSSQDPNLQNIPIRTEEGRAIRSAFIPGEAGWKLLTADYSQIELRVLAHYCGDANLQRAFAEDRDIHSQVASEVYGVALEAVTKEQRRSAKAINFGVIYGQSAFGLARSLGIPNDEAADFIDAYFAGYPGVDAFILKTLLECRKQGHVTTISGRKRPVQGVRDPFSLRDKRQRNLPERIAINTVIQGSAADIIKRAMITVLRRLREERLAARLLLQIHDELVFECPPEELTQLKALVTESMSSAAQLSVPLKVDVKSGDNWAECDAL